MPRQWPIPVDDLVGLSVRVGAVDVGTVEDVLASRGLGHVLGLVVHGRDGHGHFVPWVAADLDGEAVVLRSVFAFLSPTDLALHVDNGVRLAERARERDLLVGPDGELASRLLDAV